MEKKLLKVEGMSCMSCVSRVEKALIRTPGVQRAVVDLKAQQAEVEFDAATVDTGKLVAVIDDQGYKASVVR